MVEELSRFSRRLSYLSRGIRVRLARRLAWAVVFALVLSLLPWRVPNLTQAVERQLADAPAAVQGIAPLALGISGWADRALASIGPATVYAGGNITLTLSKRDDGPSLGEADWAPGPDPVTPGAAFVYYIQITNTGSITATVVLTEDLPSELTYTDDKEMSAGGADWDCQPLSGGTRVLCFTLDRAFPEFFNGLGPGQTAVLAIQSIVQSPLADGHVFVNASSAYAAYAENEPAYRYTGANDVETTVSAPELSIAKSIWPDPVEAGSELTLTLSISNSGSLTLTAPFTLTVVDNYPSGTGYVRQTPFPGASQQVDGGSSFTWVIPFDGSGDPDLAPGETLQAELVLAVDTPFTHTERVTNTTYTVSVSPSDRVVPSSASGSAVGVEVHSHPTLSISKVDDPDPVYADQTWSYQITVVNDAGAQGNAVGVVITDRVPVDTVLENTYAEVPGTTIETEGTTGGSLITWTLPAGFTLYWGESTTVSFTVSSVAVVVDGATVITNTDYGVTAENALAPVLGAEITTTVIGEPNLVLDKTPDGAVAIPGEPITYWIHYTNTVDATASATGLVVTDVLPSYISGGTADPAPDLGTIAAGETVTWTGLASLAPGESGRITVTLTADAVIDDGTVLENVATVDSTAGIGASDDGSYVVDSAPVLEITKSVDPSPVVRTGGTLTYTIAYSNSGNMAATGVVVIDTLDPNLTVLSTVPLSTSMVGQDITWSVGGLFPDGPRTITVVAQVVGVLPSGSLITNTAQVSCDQGVTAQTGEVTNTVQSPDVQLAKQGPAANVRVGELLTFTISVSNIGQGPAEGVIVTDTLPVNLTLVASQTVGLVYDGTVGSSYRWLASSIAPGGEGTITVTARPVTTSAWVDADGVTLWNVATATVAYDSNPADNLAQAPVTVIPGEAAAITLTVSPSSTLVPNAVSLLIVAADAYGNPAYDGDGYTVALDSDPGGLSFSSPVNVLDGVGTATASTTVAGTYEITATLSGPGAIQDTAPVTYTAGTLAGFEIAPIGQQTAGISFTILITAVDEYDNPIDGFAGVVPLADGAPVDTLLPREVTFSGGRATTYVTITLARTDEIRVGSGVTESWSNEFQVVAGEPVTVTVSANPSEALAGVDGTLTAEVVDAYGNPVAGDGVSFGISAGTLDPLAGTTDASGEATTVFSHTVPAVATAVVTASNGVTGSTVVTFVAGCADAVSVSIAPSSLPVGGDATITVYVQDAYGNDVDWATVDLETSNNLGSGSIAAPSLSLDASGQATTTVSSTAVGLKTILATVAEQRGCGEASSSGQVTYTAGGPDNVVVFMDPNPQTVGSDATLYATVLDMYSNPVAGVLVTFSLPAGVLGGGGINPLTATTNGSGVATASISSTLAGTTLLTATVNALIDDTETLVFEAGAPAAITVTVTPGMVDGGVDATLVATATDVYGNPCVGNAVDWAADPDAGIGILPNPSTVGAGGQATALISGTVSGTVTVTATAAPGVEDATTLVINSGLLDHLETSLVPDPLPAGVNFTLYVTATDSAGTQRGDSGTATLADVTGTASPTTVTLSNGAGSVVLSITEARVNDIIWLQWDADITVVGASNHFTVTAGAPYTVLLTATPGSINPGGATSSIVATVEDAYGNPVPDQAVSFDLVSAPAGTSLAVDSGTSDASGQASATVTSGNDQGTVTVEVTCGGVVNRVDVAISTYLVYLPAVMRNATGIDLRVEDIQVIDVGGGQYDIEVTIQNVGYNTLTADFWVDLYIDPSSVPGLNDLWNDLCTYGKAWFVRRSVGPGEQVVLSTSDPDDPAFPSDRYSNWPGSFTPGAHQLYAQVDSYGIPNIGAVIEYNENNNVYGPTPYTALGATFDGSDAGVPLDPRPTPVP